MSGYSPDEIAAIAGWLRDGHTARRIAVLFSGRFRPVSHNAIVGVVHRNAELSAIGFAGSVGRPKPRPYSVEDIVTLRRMWADGCSVAEIAGRLRRTVASVRTHMRNDRDVFPERSAAQTGAVPALKPVRKKGQIGGIRGGIARTPIKKSVGSFTAPFVTPSAGHGADKSPAIIPPDASPITIMDLTATTCRWPLDRDDAGNRLFCGAPCESVDSFCTYHAARAFRPRETNEYRPADSHGADGGRRPTSPDDAGAKSGVAKSAAGRIGTTANRGNRMSREAVAPASATIPETTE